MAAAASVPKEFSLYSCLGTYLGPTSILRSVKYKVEDLRSTKSFRTRKVEAWQAQADGKPDRRTMLVILDFHVKEQGMFDYSAPPARSDYPRPSELLPVHEALQQRVKDGDLKQDIVDRYVETFPLHNRYFHSRACPQGVNWQNLSGMEPLHSTVQDDLDITSKTNAWWFKSKVDLKSHADNAAALS